MTLFMAASRKAQHAYLVVVVAAVSSIHDLICRKFRLSMEADVLTSVFTSMAIAPTPTAYVV